LKNKIHRENLELKYSTSQKYTSKESTYHDISTTIKPYYSSYEATSMNSIPLQPFLAEAFLHTYQNIDSSIGGVGREKEQGEREGGEGGGMNLISMKEEEINDNDNYNDSSSNQNDINVSPQIAPKAEPSPMVSRRHPSSFSIFPTSTSTISKSPSIPSIPIPISNSYANPKISSSNRSLQDDFEMNDIYIPSHSQVLIRKPHRSLSFNLLPYHYYPPPIAVGRTSTVLNPKNTSFLQSWSKFPNSLFHNILTSHYSTSENSIRSLLLHQKNNTRMYYYNYNTTTTTTTNNNNNPSLENRKIRVRYVSNEELRTNLNPLISSMKEERINEKDIDNHNDNDILYRKEFEFDSMSHGFERKRQVTAPASFDFITIENECPPWGIIES